jgi:hypothetical protein
MITVATLSAVGVTLAIILALLGACCLTLPAAEPYITVIRPLYLILWPTSALLPARVDSVTPSLSYGLIIAAIIGNAVPYGAVGALLYTYASNRRRKS